jgi:hypothetical protein
VDDAGLVAVAQRVEDALGQLQRPLGQDLAAVPQHVAQRRALDQLHHDVRNGDAGLRVGLLPGVVHGHDVRMVEARRGLGLPPEPRLEGGVGREVSPQLLDRYRASESGVDGPADLRHPPAAQQVLQLVSATDCHRVASHRHPFSTPSHCGPSAGSALT